MGPSFRYVAILGSVLLGAANANVEARADHQEPGPTCLVAEFDPVSEAVVRKAIEAGTGFDGETFRIVLQYNVLRRSDGSGGFTQFDLIDEHLRDVNWGFRDTPFVFVRVPGVRFIDDDDYYNLDNVNEAHRLYSEFYTPGVGNIFLHDGLLFNSTTARSYTSHVSPARGHTYGDTRIGLPANIAYSPHELGHFLFLLHPFESQFAGTECVARTNCQSAGDLVCDTPASPVVFSQNTLRTGEYTGTSFGPCGGDPRYQPLTDLWMEAGWQYGDPGALIRNRFTDGQVERMVGVVRSMSRDLVGPGRPEILVDCDSDQVDDIDEILAGEEADINEDKVPDRCQAFWEPGDLLVSGMTDVETNAPRFFDGETGGFRGAFRTGAWWIHQFRIGPDGLIYLTSLSVIQRLDPVTGRFVDNLVDGGPDGAGIFVDILFDANGDLLVLDNTRSMIVRYRRADGAFVGLFSSVPMASPKYMEYGPDGNIYVVGNGAGDGRVVRIDAQSGTYLDDFVAAGSGGLTAGQGLLFHTDGFLYVSNGGAGNVLRYDAATGAFDRAFVAAAGSGGLTNPHSLRFGPDGHLYVASRGTDSVNRYDGETGEYLGDFVRPRSGGPPGTGGLVQPAGLLFAPKGRILNQGYSGAWLDQRKPGQGFLIEVLPDSGQVFLAWFTYDIAAPSGDATVGAPGHRWLTALGPFQGSSANLDVTLTSGGFFDDPAPVSNSEPGSYGTIELTFDGCASGTLRYELFAIGLSGEIPITRIAPDNVALCESLSR